MITSVFDIFVNNRYQRCLESGMRPSDVESRGWEQDDFIRMHGLTMYTKPGDK